MNKLVLAKRLLHAACRLANIQQYVVTLGFDKVSPAKLQEVMDATGPCDASGGDWDWIYDTPYEAQKQQEVLVAIAKRLLPPGSWYTRLWDYGDN